MAPVLVAGQDCAADVRLVKALHDDHDGGLFWIVHACR
jgi:hypothetical protein